LHQFNSNSPINESRQNLISQAMIGQIDPTTEEIKRDTVIGQDKKTISEPLSAQT
jgi:hypothetical protein